ncbi:MAG: hypothetical protein IJW14_01995 [Oscillospiraceae bacterium]|nr:hypothetical protein [Oscillospiraceae bacterium]
MFCTKCGLCLPEQANFCTRCGTAVYIPPQPPVCVEAEQSEMATPVENQDQY